MARFLSDAVAASWKAPTSGGSTGRPKLILSGIPGEVDPAAQAKALKAALKFSNCMRAHGITHFPDPQTSGGGISLMFKRGSGLDPQSPQFKAAQRACQNEMPGPKGGGGFSTSRSGGK